jgi:hypothetical protein
VRDPVDGPAGTVDSMPSPVDRVGHPVDGGFQRSPM